MFKSIIAATLVAAVSAASWPMVTVNSAGNIVLNSPTKAGSFQLNAVTTTAGPTSSTTASRSTVTALDADTDAFIVSVPSSPATSAGYKLPTATEGRTIRFYNSGSGKGAFTIWTASTAVFIDGTSATSIDILSTTSMVTATATSSTNWVISQNAVGSGVSNKGFLTVGSATAAATMSAADIMGGFYTVTGTAALALTTPTASVLSAADVNSANGDRYEFSVTNAATAVLATDLTVTLTAGTGITLPTQVAIVPGQTRNYIAYRVSSSAWTIVHKSQSTVMAAALAGGGTLSGAAVATAGRNALSWTETSITASAAATLNTYTFTNAYAQYGDSCTVAWTTPSAATGDITCEISADGTVTSVLFSEGGTASVITTVRYQVFKA